MVAYTLIEWAMHTLNLWWGCVHMSPACDRCYAEKWARFLLAEGWIIVGERRKVPRLTKRRDPQRPQIWGADAPRIFPPANSRIWTDPLRWNQEAAELGERHRVFLESMGDICERHRRAEVNRMMDSYRARLFTQIVPQCEWLDFLLLTKRPHDIMRVVPLAWRTNWPSNVWVGTTVEDQQRARQRLPHLVKVPASVRFISAEPLLGPLDLSPWLGDIDWVIVGGESGSGARPSEVAWVRDVRDQVRRAGRRFFFKQWGNWAQPEGHGTQLIKLRKKDSRLLDGRTWDQLPAPRP